MIDVTFVLMTCGELTERRCLAAIQSFRNRIELLEVRNVYPQIKALNQMIEIVQTPYFVPLDADIILHPNAWQRIRSALNRHQHDPQWHTILFPLWDTLTQRKILALKVMRASIMKANPFVESATPDVEHYQRLNSLGYTCIDEALGSSPIGEHVVEGSFFCYHKYRDIYQTYKAHGWEWDSGAFLGGDTLEERAVNHFHYFVGRWILTENPDYLWCLAGMMDGILSPTENQSKNLTRSCEIPAKTSIGCFVDWYLARQCTHQGKYVRRQETQSANYMF